MMLFDRQGGTGLGLTFFDAEDALRQGDEGLNQCHHSAKRTAQPLGWAVRA